MSELAGLPMQYLIGADAPKGRAGYVVVMPYGAPPAPNGISVAYGNLFDQRPTYNKARNIGLFGPYLPRTDTAEQYSEGVVDPRGEGWEKNLKDQFGRHRSQGFEYVELDNPDAYETEDVLKAVRLAATYGLKVIAKNPGLCDSPKAYVEHPNVYGIIVEKGAGDPPMMDTLRRLAGKPLLPVWFVGFEEEGLEWVGRIKGSAEKFLHMGVTQSDGGEYTGARDIVVPRRSATVQPTTTPFAPPQPRPAAAKSVTLAQKIVEACETHRCPLDKGPNEINIIYVEGMNPDGTKNENTPNFFNDLRTVLTFVEKAPILVGAWEATTEPGRYYTENPLNVGGAARIALGQQRAWQVGMHRGDHEALVQTGGPVTVLRDRDENFERVGDKNDTGWFGINQHWGYDFPLKDIKTASAGCLVGRTREGHREFMKCVKSDPRYKANKGFVFKTTVLPALWVLRNTAVTAPLPPVTVAPELKRVMASWIVNYEARRDSKGRLTVYELPSGDGGGAYEVAGINEKYHPVQAAKLKAMIEAGDYEEAEESIIDYLVAYTDVVEPWVTDPGVQFVLRDCAFNRGPTGAARILQRAVGTTVDGIVGPLTRAAAARMEPTDLIEALEGAREAYERQTVGRDESSKFWKGLVSRWEKATARGLLMVDRKPPTMVAAKLPPLAPPKPTPVAPTPEPSQSIVSLWDKLKSWWK